MDNRFITRFFDWEKGASRTARLANTLLRKAGKQFWVRAPGSTGYMTSVEVRMNLYHLVSQVLAYDVPGDFVELGTFVGHTAVMIGKVLAAEGDGSRKLHVYDTFTPLWETADPLATLKQNFAQYEVEEPQIHAGWFADTLPSGLPEKISFVHVDCGWGRDPEEHGRVIREAMGLVYPRLSRGAVCSFIDYGLPPEVMDNQNPGVKAAIDGFLSDKPETMSPLHAGEYGHAYFRKL